MIDADRIYELLRIQGETLATIVQSQQDTKERLFGANGQPGALLFLQNEITKTNGVVSTTNDLVAKHTDQISFWRGAIAAIAMLFTSAAAWAGIVLSRHR